LDTTQIVQAIDAEIDRLSKARKLLTGHTGTLKRGLAPSGDAPVPKLMSRCTQIPEYARTGCFAAVKPRNLLGRVDSKAGNESIARKWDRVIFVVNPRTNFNRNFIRAFNAIVLQ
jgi:hypothetical protein